MKALKIVKAATLLVLLIGSGAVAVGQPPQNSHDDQYAYVFVTGSNIPQRVKIKSIGTLTNSPIRIYNRDEIYKTGRFTTEGVLAQDPSVSINIGRPGGGM